MYIAIASLIAATLALALAAATARGPAQLEFLALAALAAALALALLMNLRSRTGRLLLRLRGIAYEDPLTGLANRAFAEDQATAFRFMLMANVPETKSAVAAKWLIIALIVLAAALVALAIFQRH